MNNRAARCAGIDTRRGKAEGAKHRGGGAIRARLKSYRRQSYFATAQRHVVDRLAGNNMAAVIIHPPGADNANGPFSR